MWCSAPPRTSASILRSTRIRRWGRYMATRPGSNRSSGISCRTPSSSRRMENTVEVAVTDTGRGIRPEFLPLVFEPFQQADTFTTRTHGGLGLGLAIVKHLVEAHGGTVSAESAGDSAG